MNLEEFKKEIKERNPKAWRQVQWDIPFQASRLWMKFKLTVVSWFYQDKKQ